MPRPIPPEHVLPVTAVSWHDDMERRVVTPSLRRIDCHHSLEVCFKYNEIAVYYLRETALDECIGYGAFAGICPVQAVVMDHDDRPVVDSDWCIGCGVCMVSCPADVITLVRRQMK
jgi:MinD superfamily P-loop ATPase